MGGVMVVYGGEIGFAEHENKLSPPHGTMSKLLNNFTALFPRHQLQHHPLHRNYGIALKSKKH